MGETYLEAVSPFGFIQLTSETSINEPNGYDYYDSTIFWLSYDRDLLEPFETLRRSVKLNFRIKGCEVWLE